MGWVFDGLEEQDYGREYKDLTLLKRVIQDLLPFKLGFFITATMVIITTVLNLLSPLVLGYVINTYSSSQSNDQIILIGAASYLIICIMLFGSYFLGQWGNIKMVPDFMVNMRVKVFTSLQKQDMKFYDKRQSGRLSSRVGSDAAQVGNIIGILAVFSGNFLLIFLSYAVLFFISPPLATIALVVVPFVILVTLGFRRLARQLSRQFRVSVASVNSAIAESVEGIKIAKSYGREKETSERFGNVNTENYTIGSKFTLIMGLLFPAIDLFFVLGIWVVLFFGSPMAIQGINHINAGNLYIFVLYLNTFFFPLMQLSTFYSQLQAGFGSYERILEVIDTVPEVKENLDGVVINDFKGEIKFQDVTFGYKNDQSVLKNFNLTIKAGEKLAIVGHTGAGKTTLFNLLARYYEYQDGQILIDGHDLRTLNLKEYRKHIGVVPQDPFLFSGTVKENIIYGRQQATEADVQRAIEAVHADEFLQYMPEGLDTNVRERGSRLSTGQRQLVCFARALLANPEILILDEATSSVDAYTETVIQEALEALFKGRTSIIIAHRLSTVVNADRIIVMDHGRIIEEGTHRQLLQLNGKYKEVYDIYFKHQAIDWKPQETVEAIEVAPMLSKNP